MSEQADFWNERYRGEEFAFGEAPNAFLAAQSEYLQAGMRALLPGDGQGRNGVWVASRGLIVDTVDISALGVEKARVLARSRGVQINAQIADLLTWDWPRNVYDVVAALYVHLFDADRPRMHRAMLEALKPGGVLIFEAFNIGQLEIKKKHNSGGPGTPDLLYSIGKLTSDFEGGEIVLMDETMTELAEGHRHKGPAAVIRAIVRKPER